MAGTLIQTTDGVAPHERWDLWKALALAAVDSGPSGPTAAFRAARSVGQVAQGTLIATASDPIWLKRSRRNIARDGIDHACLVLAVDGRGIIAQDGRPENVVETGDMVLYDLGRPYAAASAIPYRELRLYVPRDLFAARVGRIEDLSGLQFRSGGTFGLFKGYLAAYAAALPTLSERDADVALDGVLHLLSGLVGSVLDAKGDGGADLARDTLLALVRQHIQARLADPDLDVAGLARAVGVSRTRLYAAFAEEGGVAAAIRDARLDRARQRLLAPADRGRTIEEVARACGFAEYSTFARAFRRRFGASPGEWRAQ